jgi:hypothetical protein
MYHLLLAKSELSDGQSDIPVWPRKYRNLSLYGEKLWQEYAQEVKKVTRQYFSEVIKELEKRKAFDQGSGEKKIAEIANELGCGDELQKRVGTERSALEKVIDDWDAWNKSHSSLMEFRERWKAFFILDRTPSCTPLSIQVTLENDNKDLEEVGKALREATLAVEEIVGRSATDEKTLQPAVHARAGAVIYPSGSQERKKMINEYRAYLDSLRQRSMSPAIRIAGPEVVEEGMPAEFTVVLDRDAASVRYDWKFASGGEGERLEGAKTARITWIPSAAGKKVLEAHALVDVPGAEWARATHAVTVLSAEEAPKPKVRLTCPVTAFSAGESVPITAEAVDYGLGGKGFIRYLWSVDGVQVGSSAENVFVFDGVGYEERKVVVTVQARTENNTHVQSSITLDVLPPGPADGEIRVLIDPAVSEAVYGNVVRFEGIAFPKRGGGDLKYQWAVNGEFAGDEATFLFDTAPWQGKTVEISFYAAQMIDGDLILYEGQTARKVKVVAEVPVSVSIADHPAGVDDSMDLRLCVVEANDELAYEWVEWNGPADRWSTNTVGVGRCMLKSARGLAGQVLRFKVTATDSEGRLASAETGLIKVVEPAWPADAEADQGTGNEEQAESGIQAGDDQQKKPVEEPASSTSEQPSATEKTEPQTAVVKEGDWLKSGLSAGWEIGRNEEKNWSAKMSRVIAEKSENCRQQTAHGTITAKIESSFIPRPEEVEKKLRSLVENNGWYPEEESMQSFSLGRFKGKMITTTLKYQNGFGNPMAGYRDGTAHIHGHVIALDQDVRRMININFSVYGGSCWNNSGKDNAMAQARAAKAEAISIINGLSFHANKQDSQVQAGTSTPDAQADQKEKKKEYRLTLSRVSPPSGPVIVGSSVTFTAVLSGDKPEGAVKYQFEPHPEVTFTPHETNTGATAAVFSKPDKVMVWVTAIDATGTIATSEQLEIEVQKPHLQLVFEPGKPLVGQEVKAKVTVQPEVKDIDFRWLPVPGNAKHSMTSKDGREITFYLKDEKAAEIKVNARVPFSGEDLGEAKASVAAKKYNVVVSPPKAMGPPPKVWKEGVGLVVVEKAIAVEQIVEFSVAIEPSVLSGPVKYRWAAKSGACRVSNPASSVARVTANEAGSCELMITVRDRNDVELGSGTGSFTASVTEENIKQGTKNVQGGETAKGKVQNAKDEAQALWKEAEHLQREQKYVEALQKYKDGLALLKDPIIQDRAKKLEKYIEITKGSKAQVKPVSKETEAQVGTVSTPPAAPPPPPAKTDSGQSLRSPATAAPANPPLAVSKAGKSLNLAQTIYAPYEEIQLHFTATSEAPTTTWVGLIPAAVPHGSNARNDQNDLTFQSVKGRASGQMVFQAPNKEGSYDFRMSSSQDDQEYVSMTFTVAVPEHTASLQLSKKIFAPNEKIKLAFAASPRMPQTTWVGLIPESVAHGSTVRNDQHDTTFQTVKGRASGEMVFRAPNKIGTYSFRMNETTNDKEVAAVSFKVAVPMDGNTLTLAKTSFAPNEEMKLDFQASALLASNTWVGLIPANIPHGSTARNDQHDTTFQVVKGRASGQMVFRAPTKIGTYSFRMNETTNDKEVATVSFEVAVPMDGNTLTLAKTTFAPNEEIQLDFKASALLASNTWVGLIPANIPHGSTARNDQHDTTFQTVKGRTSGQMVFRAPNKAGQYSFRMSESTNDKEVANIVFTVAEGKN